MPFPTASGNTYWEMHGRVVNGASSFIGIARIGAGASTIRMRHYNTLTTTADVLGGRQSDPVRIITVNGTYETG
ncbi:MAG: hypothetical protein J7507_09675 [Pseudoxanthomonas sp.]|nr:hypothetical protein [Pseudoxanthomonas sp.]